MAFVEALAEAGLPVVEVTSFVSPHAVPQLADADEVLQRVRRRPGVRYPVLVPNMRGMERAERAGADAVAVFTAASEAFNERNIGMSIDGSLEEFRPMLARARRRWAGGAAATSRPRSGAPTPAPSTLDVSRRSASPCSSSGATRSRWATRSASRRRTTCAEVCDALLEHVPIDRLALHLHDTRGRALDNVEAALGRGVSIFDSSAGGTGGCPFAPGAPGNLATESLCALLDRLGIEHGVDQDRVAAAAAAIRSEFTRA